MFIKGVWMYKKPLPMNTSIIDTIIDTVAVDILYIDIIIDAITDIMVLPTDNIDIYRAVK